MEGSVCRPSDFKWLRGWGRRTGVRSIIEMIESQERLENAVLALSKKYEEEARNEDAKLMEKKSAKVEVHAGYP